MARRLLIVLVAVAFIVFFGGYSGKQAYLDKLDLSKFETRKNSTFHLADQTDGLMWFIQLSDIHLRQNGFTTDSFSSFIKNAKEIVSPKAFLLTGDISHGQDMSTTSVGTKQEEYEWKWYSNLLENESLVSENNKCDKMLDIRGNHDGVGVYTFFSEQDYWSNFSSCGTKNDTVYSKKFSVSSEGTFFDFPGKVAGEMTVSFLMYDSTLSPGMILPFNYFGDLGKFGDQTKTREEYISDELPKHEASDVVFMSTHAPMFVMTSKSKKFLKDFVMNELKNCWGFLEGHHHYRNMDMPIWKGEVMEAELDAFTASRALRLIAVDHGIVSYVDDFYVDKNSKREELKKTKGIGHWADTSEADIAAFVMNAASKGYKGRMPFDLTLNKVKFDVFRSVHAELKEDGMVHLVGDEEDIALLVEESKADPMKLWKELNPHPEQERLDVTVGRFDELKYLFVRPSEEEFVRGYDRYEKQKKEKQTLRETRRGLEAAKAYNRSEDRSEFEEITFSSNEMSETANSYLSARLENEDMEVNNVKSKTANSDKPYLAWGVVTNPMDARQTTKRTPFWAAAESTHIRALVFARKNELSDVNVSITCEDGTPTNFEVQMHKPEGAPTESPLYVAEWDPSKFTQPFYRITLSAKVDGEFIELDSHLFSLKNMTARPVSSMGRYFLVLDAAFWMQFFFYMIGLGMIAYLFLGWFVPLCALCLGNSHMKAKIAEKVKKDKGAEITEKLKKELKEEDGKAMEIAMKKAFEKEIAKEVEKAVKAKATEQGLYDRELSLRIIGNTIRSVVFKHAQRPEEEKSETCCCDRCPEMMRKVEDEPTVCCCFCCDRFCSVCCRWFTDDEVCCMCCGCDSCKTCNYSCDVWRYNIASNTSGYGVTKSNGYGSCDGQYEFFRPRSLRKGELISAERKDEAKMKAPLVSSLSLAETSFWRRFAQGYIRLFYPYYQIGFWRSIVIILYCIAFYLVGPQLIGKWDNQPTLIFTPKNYIQFPFIERGVKEDLNSKEIEQAKSPLSVFVGEDVGMLYMLLGMVVVYLPFFALFAYAPRKPPYSVGEKLMKKEFEKEAASEQQTTEENKLNKRNDEKEKCSQKNCEVFFEWIGAVIGLIVAIIVSSASLRNWPGSLAAIFVITLAGFTLFSLLCVGKQTAIATVISMVIGLFTGIALGCAVAKTGKGVVIGLFALCVAGGALGGAAGQTIEYAGLSPLELFFNKQKRKKNEETQKLDKKAHSTQEMEIPDDEHAKENDEDEAEQQTGDGSAHNGKSSDEADDPEPLIGWSQVEYGYAPPPTSETRSGCSCECFYITLILYIIGSVGFFLVISYMHHAFWMSPALLWHPFFVAFILMWMNGVWVESICPCCDDARECCCSKSMGMWLCWPTLEVQLKKGKCKKGDSVKDKPVSSYNQSCSSSGSIEEDSSKNLGKGDKISNQKSELLKELKRNQEAALEERRT